LGANPGRWVPNTTQPVPNGNVFVAGGDGGLGFSLNPPTGNGGAGGSPGGTAGQTGSDGVDGVDGIFIGEADRDDTVGPRKRRAPALASRPAAYKAVSFVQPAASADGTLAASCSAIVSAPDKALVARAGDARVMVDKGAAALVVKKSGSATVFCLHGNVRLFVKEQTIRLRAGEVAVTTGDGVAFNEAYGLTEVPIRLCTQHSLDGERQAFIGEYSLPAAMSKIECLRRLQCSNQANQRALYAAMLKNAAVLHMVTAARGPYKMITSGN
jgi:hypothetical protein